MTEAPAPSIPPAPRRLPRAAFVALRPRASIPSTAPHLAWSDGRAPARAPILDLAPIERGLAGRGPRVPRRHALMLALAAALLATGFQQSQQHPAHRARVVPAAVERGHVVT